MLEESVVYQDILRKGRKQGKQSGLQEGLQQGESKFALLVLEERFGKLAPKLRKQIECLPAPQLEALGKALVYFKEPEELTAWLQKNTAVN